MRLRSCDFQSRVQLGPDGLQPALAGTPLPVAQHTTGLQPVVSLIPHIALRYEILSRSYGAASTAFRKTRPARPGTREAGRGEGRYPRVDPKPSGEEAYPDKDGPRNSWFQRPFYWWALLDLNQ